MKHMHTTLRSLILTLAFALSAAPAFAQATTTQTTLTNAVTTPTPINQVATTQIVLASITNVQAGGSLWVSDGNGEEMQILAVPTSASLPVTVLRGVNGTKTAAHPANSLVWVATASQTQSQIFHHGAKTGVCVPAQEASLPQINVDTGDVQNCNPNTRVAGVATAFLWGSASTNLDWPAMPVTLISNANYTALASDTFIVYNTMTANRVVTIGAMSIPGKTLTISNNSFSPFLLSINGLIAGSTTYALSSGSVAAGGNSSQTIRLVWSGVAWFTM